MDTNRNPFTGLPEHHTADSGHLGSATDSGCRRKYPVDIESAVLRFQFVTLAFDRSQTVFDLPQWRWPLIGPYNGFTGGERIRGWQLLRFYELNGWLRYPEVCSVTGRRSGIVLHNEDYSRPWHAYPVSRRTHTLIHTRTRHPRAWQSFLETEALPDAWAHSLLSRGFPAPPREPQSARMLLDASPHPEWVRIRIAQFDRR